MRNNKIKITLAGVTGAFILALMMGIPDQLHAFRAPDEDSTHIKESTILPQKQVSRTDRIPSLKSILMRNLNQPLRGEAFIEGDAGGAAKRLVDKLLMTGAVSGDQSLSVDGPGAPQRVLSTTFETRVKRIQTDKLGYKHVRLAQYYQGLSVVGGEIIVHIKNGNLVYQINGQYLPQINVSVTPSLDAEAALEFGLDEHQGKEGLHVAKQPALVIYGGHLAYHYVISYEGEELGQWQYYVDAHSGEVIFRYNNIQPAAPNESLGSHQTVSGNPLSGEDEDSVSITGFWESTGSGNYFLYNFNDLWGIYDRVVGDWEQQGSGNWETADRHAISCGKNMKDIQDYVSAVLGRNSFDDAGAFGRANVHETDDYCPINAWWDGMDWHFCDGDGIFANEFCVLDIAAHEYGHALTQYTSDLVYANEPGALNEAYSDMIGAAVEFWVQPDGTGSYPNATPGHDDWLVGEDTWLIDVALRDMRDPQRYQQPSYYHGTHWYFGSADNGGVHTNSGVANYAYYLLAEGCLGSCVNDGHAYDPITGIGISAATEVAWRANSVYHNSNDQYSDARNAWISAAADLGYPTATVEAVWDAVGVGTSPDDCPTVTGGDFEGGVIPPTEWTHVQNNTTETWQINNSIPYEGAYAAECLYDPTLVNQDEWLVTRYVTDPTEVNFWSMGSLYWCRDTFDNCDLEVWLINGSGVNDGDDVYLGKADDDWPADFIYAKSTFSISPPAGTPVRIGFRYVGNDGAQIIFDLVKVCSDSVSSDCALVNDGSFESGPPPASAWTEWIDTGCESIMDPGGPWGIPADDGTYAFWAGGYCGSPNTGYVEQRISIPTDATLLKFKTVFYRVDADDPPDNDQFIVSIDGIPVFSRDMITASNTFPNWVRQEVDISAYAGQTVNLRFEGVSKGSSTGNVLVEHIETCSLDPGEKPATERIVLGLEGPQGKGWMEVVDKDSPHANLAWLQVSWPDYNNVVGGTHPALCNLDDDAEDELVVGLDAYPAQGGWLEIKDDRTTNYAHLGWYRVPWKVYNAANGATYPACGNFDGDDRDEIAIGLGSGAGGWVEIVDDDLTHLDWLQVPWSAYNAANGATYPACGDLDGDGRDEIAIGLGNGAGGWMEIKDDGNNDYAHLNWTQVSWKVYNAANGTSYPTCGDFDGDGRDEIAIGLGSGAGGWVEIIDHDFSHLDWLQVAWSAYNAANGATYPAAGDLDGDGLAELVIGLGTYPAAGGWFEVKDDQNTAFGHLSWGRLHWSVYNNTNGNTRPGAER